MKKENNYFELVVGTIVLVCAVYFFFSSVNKAKVRTGSGYNLIAKFDNISGIGIGSDVKISGIKIGEVDEEILDGYRAKVVLKINKSVAIPADSSVRVASEGLLGQRYLAVNPGGDEQNLKNGEEINYTQSSVDLEELMGRFIFNGANSKK